MNVSEFYSFIFICGNLFKLLVVSFSLGLIILKMSNDNFIPEEVLALTEVFVMWNNPTEYESGQNSGRNISVFQPLNMIKGN